jgi:hypothetical protein
MEQLLLIPSCEKHGGLKVWVNDRSNRNGGFYRCRECNAEDSRRRNARNGADPEKKAQLNRESRRRYHAQPEDKRKERIDQCVDYARERLRADPVLRKKKNEYQNARWATIPLRDHRAANLKKCYGITHEEYDRMLAAQGGKCAICESTTSRTKRSDYLYVDHCHDTGAIRGLLCGPCNAGIGSLGDNVGRLEAAIRYLNEAALGAVTRTAA